MTVIYIGMCADILHPGHLNIINEARKLKGEIVIGLLTDEAIASYKRVPYMTYDQRKIVVENIRGVKKVIKQTTLDYTENLEKIKPNFVLHGDDWKKGTQAQTRKKVVDTIAVWGGIVIDVPYTQGISSTEIIEKIKK